MIIILILILQATLSLFAGYGIFLLWRRVAASSRAIYWIVTAGFLIRAVGGVVAFWISYLGLPVARSLQVGDGLWIFAVDAQNYFHDALVTARHGPAAILFLAKAHPSVFYVQALAAALLFFGFVTSTAILMNLASWLGTCLAIISFADPKRHKSVVFAIAALSFSPSMIVWSLQPLKDVFFLLMLALLFVAARCWQQLCQAQVRPRAVSCAVWIAAMAVVLYGISGIRFYFGLIIIAAAVPFAVMTIVRTRWRMFAGVSAVILLPVLMIAFLVGAGPYVPPQVRAVLAFRSLKPKKEFPRAMLGAIDQSREAFDRAGGATMIGAGRAIQQIDRTMGKQERQTFALRPEERVSRAKPTPPPPAPAKAPERPATTTTPKTDSAAHAHPAPKEVPKPIASSTDKPVPPPSVPKTVDAAPKNAPVHASPRPAVVPAPAATPADTRLGTPIAIPASPTARVVAGFAALVVPRSIAQRLGILDVRGGRGLWLFVELDTIAFDVVLLFALVSLIGAIRRRALGVPVFWLCFLVTAMIAGALAYTVSNFGTLFRHRDMILFGLLLLPVAMLGGSAEAPEREAAQA